MNNYSNTFSQICFEIITIHRLKNEHAKCINKKYKNGEGIPDLTRKGQDEEQFTNVYNNLTITKYNTRWRLKEKK